MSKEQWLHSAGGLTGATPRSRSGRVAVKGELQGKEQRLCFRKPLQYSCLENPMNSMKRQNDRILKEELPRSVGAQYATGVQWRNKSRKNEETEPKQKQHPLVDVTGNEVKSDAVKSYIA